MLYNRTQNHLVFQGKSNWKNDPLCDCHKVMHRYHWEPIDEIYSVLNGKYTLFEYKQDTNEMILSDKDYEKPYITHPLTVLSFGCDNEGLEKQGLHAPIWHGSWKCDYCWHRFYYNYISDDRRGINIKK